jgi:hypothetical protein
MGSSCNITKKPYIEQSNVIKLTSKKPKPATITPTKEPIINPVIEDKFPDFPEFGKKFITTEDEYTGEGIKQLKAYKCNIPYDTLNNIRKQFWDEHKNRLWPVIRSACETDHLSALEILNNYQLVCLESCMKCIVEPTNGTVYNLPNFVINDPLYKKEDVLDDEKLLNVNFL